MGRMAALFLFPRTAQFVLAALLAAAWPAAAWAGDTLSSLRADFQHQTDPVKRAKQFPKLGSALLAEMRKDIQAQDYDRVATLLTEYRDGAAAAFNGLQAAGREAGKHPAGYRELEIHLRGSLHTINDILFALPVDNREALRAPQRDLELLDERLVKALFPSDTQGGKTPPSSPEAHPQKR